MNERLKKLAKEAGYRPLRGFEFANSLEEIYLNKFAELIVRECLEQVDKVESMLEDDKEKLGAAWVGLGIAKHFGVE